MCIWDCADTIANSLDLCQVCLQVAGRQIGGAEVAQRVAVAQRQLEEAGVLRLCTGHSSPCCSAKPTQKHLPSEEPAALLNEQGRSVAVQNQQYRACVERAHAHLSAPTHLVFTRWKLARSSELCSRLQTCSSSSRGSANMDVSFPAPCPPPKGILAPLSKNTDQLLRELPATMQVPR